MTSNRAWLMAAGLMLVSLMVSGAALKPTAEIAISRSSAGQMADRRVIEGSNRRDVPLGGGATVLGTYYVEVKANGQKLRLQLDTGSSTTFLPSSSCRIYEDGVSVRACSFYNSPLSLSNTTAVSCSKKACSSCESGCVLKTTYADGSGVSSLARRVTMTLGNISSTAIVGMVYQSSPKFRYDSGTQIDGLIGVGYASAFPTVLDTWLEASGAGNAFAIQLGPRGGALSLGGYNPNYFHGELFWTPLIGNSGWYETVLPRIVVGATVISYSGAQSGLKSVIDSGTTHLMLPTSVFNQVVSAIQAHVATNHSASDSFTAPWDASIFNSATCHTDIVLDEMPVIRFTFDRKVNISEEAKGTKSSFTLSMEPKRYMYQLTTSTGRACVSFGLVNGGRNPLVLGDAFLTSFYTVIDRQNRRIGLAYTNDSSTVVATNEPVTLTRDPEYANSRRDLPTPSILVMLIFLYLLV